MLVQLEFILEVQAISFFLNINILITVSIIHMSAWVLHEVYKYITYPWHWHSNSKFVQSCRLNWLSSQTNLTSSTTSWIIYEDNKPTFAIYFIMNNINLRPIQSLKLGIVYFFSLPTARKWKWGAARYFINPLLSLNHIVLCNSCMHETCHQNIQINTSKEKLTAREQNRQSLKNILSCFFSLCLLEKFYSNCLESFSGIFLKKTKQNKKTSDYNMYKEISKYD